MSDILISNGARRMDRQDAIVPQKLLSPTSAASPPIRSSSIQPSAGHPQAPAERPPTSEINHQHTAIQHTPELTRDRSADDESHSIEPATPRASGFSDPSRRSSEGPEIDPYAHGDLQHHHHQQYHEQHHQRDMNSTYSYTYSDEDHVPAELRSSDDFTNGRSSGEMTNERISFSQDRQHREQLPPPKHAEQHESASRGPHTPPRDPSTRRREGPEVGPVSVSSSGPVQEQYREIPLIAPTPIRDTIHGIVSHYGRDHRDSMISYDSEYDISQDTISMSPSSASGRQGGRGSDDEERDGLEELRSPIGPPAKVFDLTPGREPSPMRYRHGEPLQFGKSIIHDWDKPEMV